MCKLNDKSQARILVMTAVSVEEEAVKHGLGNDKRFDVKVAGVGPVAAAVNTARALANGKYDLVVSAGIGGGFPGKAEVGSIVLANEIIGADLGVETAQGFSSLDELGYGSSRITLDSHLVKEIADALIRAELQVKIGPILTVSTATGTAESAGELIKRIPGAISEAMEGYGVALAAYNWGVPVIEIRTISNLVGPRDRESWRIKEALDVLKSLSIVLSEVL